ncbi:MAG: nucleotidyl transferase AbiEii/AbiGii toxin family protein [bacterium]|nr:nucleotidyl transferase AbiEii/AbiGii toxin family protein [bacterium]
MDNVLINKPEYFKEATIERLQKEFNFSQRRHIEMLMLDFEILAQLESIVNKFILKGGAAAQIYLPVEKQRASRDIDIATTLSKEEIEIVLEKIKVRFEAHIINNEHFKWQHIPLSKESTKRIEEFNRYEITIPTKFGISLGRKAASNLRIDIIHYEKLPFVVNTINTPTIFKLPLKPFQIISRGSLIADKILTLADNTVGILAIKQGDYQSYLKQVYDLIHLTNQDLSDIEVLGDTIITLGRLTPIEVSYRKLSKRTEEILKDIINSLGKRRYFDLDTGNEAKALRNAIIDFQGEYLNKSEWVISQVWATRISKLRFITGLVLLHIEKKIKLEEISKALKQLSEAEAKIVSLKGDEIKKMQEKLSAYFRGEGKIAKQMKHTMPIRIFYGIITKENLEEIIKNIEKC